MIWVLLLVFLRLNMAVANCWDNSSYSTITRLNPHLPHRDREFSPRRIVDGPLYQMGDFRGCLFLLEEKYCLASVQLSRADKSSQLWRRIQESNEVRTHFRRDMLTVGVCVPLECTHSDVREGLQESLEAAAHELGVSISITVDEKNCQTNVNLPFTAADYIVGVIILSIFLLVLVGSSYDGLRRYQGSTKPPPTIGGRFLVCFSFLKNLKRLGTLNNSEDSRSFHCIQGMRALTMYLVISAHTIFWAIRGPIQNPEWVEKSYSDFFRSSFMNGNAIMGTFLSISGILLGYMFVKEVSKKGTFTTSDFFKLLLHRYIRLSPVYAVMLALACSWFNHFGRGPMWPKIVSEGVEECQQSWWWHLLYVNNYINANKTCMAHTWYLAVDFQCFLASIPVLIFISKHPKYRTWIFSLVMSFWVFIPFVHTYIEKLNPVVLYYPETILHLEHDQTFLRTYVPFHTNYGAYFVGLIFGVICYYAKLNGVKKTKIKIFLTWSIGLTVPSTFLVLSYIFFQPSYQYEVVSASIYAAIYKTLFAMGIAVMIVGCALGFGWKANTVLSWRPFQVLGRLSYNTYLIHFCVQRMQAGATKEPLYLDEYALARSTMADVAVSVLLALILCLCVEMPSSAIPKIFTPQNKIGNTTPNYKNSTNKDSQLQSVVDCTGSTSLQEKVNLPQDYIASVQL